MGGGLPDAALPAERHLVFRPHVPVGAVAAAGLPLLLPQHGAGLADHHPALHTGQEGASCRVSCEAHSLRVYSSFTLDEVVSS